jgi:zinc/manganese transport system permease protein
MTTAPGRHEPIRPASGTPPAIELTDVTLELGVTLAFYTDWPTSFWITALAALAYVASLAVRRLRG